jgi:hypothetical protein
MLSSWCNSARLKRDNAAERHCRSWAAPLPWLNWPLGWRGIYTFFSLSQPLSSTSRQPDWRQQLFAQSLSSPLLPPSSQAFLCYFLINPWEKKALNSIRE